MDRGVDAGRGAGSGVAGMRGSSGGESVAHLRNEHRADDDRRRRTRRRSGAGGEEATSGEAGAGGEDKASPTANACGRTHLRLPEPVEGRIQLQIHPDPTSTPNRPPSSRPKKPAGRSRRARNPAGPRNPNCSRAPSNSPMHAFARGFQLPRPAGLEGHMKITIPPGSIPNRRPSSRRRKPARDLLAGGPAIGEAP